MKIICVGILLLNLIVAAPAQRQRTTDRTSPVSNQSFDARSSETTQQSGLEQRVADLSQQISNGLTENQKRTIAVIEFADLKGRVTDFGRFLAEELITRLYQTKKFKVIERQLLNKIISEQKLSLTGMVDPKSAQQLGRVLGVDAIASGTVTDLGRTLRVNARLIDTATAEIFAVASTEIAKDEAVTRLMGTADDAASGASSAGAPSNTSQTTAQTKRPTRKVDAQFFTFDLQRCRLSGTAVACDFIITNNDQDRRLTIGSNSTMFDESGNQYRSGVMQLANSDGYGVNSYLISGVKTRARVTFDKVSPDATKITLLHLALYVDPGGQFDVQYRNVPLREQSASDGEGGDETADKSETASVRYGREQTFTIYGNRQWTDTGIDVEPGLHLDVTASGAVTTGQNTAANQILGSVLRNAPRVPPRSVGPTALLAKIRYPDGRESKTLVVGARNTLIIEKGEYGRLLFGINDKNVSDNSGSFTVKVSW